MYFRARRSISKCRSLAKVCCNTSPNPGRAASYVRSFPTGLMQPNDVAGERLVHNITLPMWSALTQINLCIPTNKIAIHGGKRVCVLATGDKVCLKLKHSLGVASNLVPIPRDRVLDRGTLSGKRTWRVLPPIFSNAQFGRPLLAFTATTASTFCSSEDICMLSR